MPLNHLLLALAVVFVWGTNFVVIRWGLDGGMPPLLFATLRFALSALPWVLFMPRPAVGWRQLAGFGVLLGVGQFGLLYLAIQGHISPGLASLVIQLQVFFTIGLSLVLLKERVRGFQVVGLLMALGGLALIALNLGAQVSWLGLGLVLAAAFFWACANLVAKSAAQGRVTLGTADEGARYRDGMQGEKRRRATWPGKAFQRSRPPETGMPSPPGSGVALPPVNMLHFVVWSSVFAVPPLLALSLLFEGPAAIGHALQTASAATWATVLWQALGNSLFGYGAWNWLLSRHPAATVTPMALLVPLFGMGASALLLGEAMPGWKLGACALVLGGLGLIVLWPRFQAALSHG